MKIFDLSVTIANYGYDPRSPEVIYYNHQDNIRYYANVVGIEPSDFPEGEGLNTELVLAITHTGTHMDAPWHYGSEHNGEKAMTIDDVPLEWCFGDGVVLDFRSKQAHEVITEDDIIAELDRISYRLKPFDIPCIMTLGGDQYLTNKNYAQAHSGITVGALNYFLDQGVKTIATDGWSLDKPMKYMKEDCAKGYENSIWPVHFEGRKRPYCHIEKLANLDLLPEPFGFKIYAFPIKIMRASAGWCRPVAIY